MSKLTRDRTAGPISRDQILRYVRGQGNIHFPCSADHEQDWQPYPVDPFSTICDDHTYILPVHTHTRTHTRQAQAQAHVLLSLEVQHRASGIRIATDHDTGRSANAWVSTTDATIGGELDNTIAKSMYEEHLCVVALTSIERGTQFFPLASYFLV